MREVSLNTFLVLFSHCIVLERKELMFVTVIHIIIWNNLAIKHLFQTFVHILQKDNTKSLLSSKNLVLMDFTRIFSVIALCAIMSFLYLIINEANINSNILIQVHKDLNSSGIWNTMCCLIMILHRSQKECT